VINGFEAEAVAARLSVLILGTHLLKHSEELVLEMADRVDGLAILCGTCSDETVRRLDESGVPIVLMARHPIDGIPTVRVDNTRPTIDLTLHLLQVHGYRDLVFVGNPEGSPDTTDRWEAFVEAHRLAGVEPPHEPIRVGQDQKDGLLAANLLLDRASPPRALVCTNDETALGAYSAATTRGVRIPEQLAITGWDDITMASLLTPPLTTVRQPMRELGTKTAQLLLARINRELDGPADVVLPTETLIRASCGCPAVEPRLRLN
jgi:LacI family transcriptional regulator